MARVALGVLLSNTWSRSSWTPFSLQKILLIMWRRLTQGMRRLVPRHGEDLGEYNSHSCFMLKASQPEVACSGMQCFSTHLNFERFLKLSGIKLWESLDFTEIWQNFEIFCGRNYFVRDKQHSENKPQRERKYFAVSASIGSYRRRTLVIEVHKHPSHFLAVVVAFSALQIDMLAWSESREPIL